MNLRIIYDNAWRKGTVLTPSSEDFKHPTSDTQVDTKEQHYKASSKTSPCNVPVDLLTAQVIDFVAILGHNFEPSGVTIQFQGADNSGFSSGLVTKTLTYNAVDIFEFFTSMTKQYVRVRLTKGSDFTDFPQFATVICGQAFAPNRNIGKDYAEGSEDYSEKEYSDSHVLFSQEKPILDTGRYPFRGLNDTTRNEIVNLFFKEVGVHKAFVLCFDKDAANTSSWFVMNKELVSPVYVKDNVWTWELSVEEVK